MPTKTAAPTNIAAYMKSLSPERREMVQAIRDAVNANLDPLFEEGLQYNMPAWYVPHAIYPAGYHCDPKQPLPFASVASQKNHVGIYLFCIYQDAELRDWFVDAWKATGKKLDMGKSCIRVRKLEDVPLDVLGKAIKKMKAKPFIAQYDSVRPDGPQGVAKPAAKKTAQQVSMKTARKPASKKTGTRTATRKR